MELQKYQKLVAEFAKYPFRKVVIPNDAPQMWDDDDLRSQTVQDFTYPCEGLVNELLEALEKAWDNASEYELQCEVGDVLWYTSELHRLLGLELTHPAAIVRTCDRIGSAPSAALLGMLERPMLRAAGKLLGTSKKLLRDRLGKLDDKFTERLRSNLAEFSAAFFTALYAMGWTPEAIADINYAKLSGRNARGQLTGDGDHRGETSAPAAQ